MRLRAALFGALALAAACSAPLPAPGPAPARTALPGPDTCGRAPHVGLVGQDATALERVLIMRPVRVIRPGMAVTEEFRPDRINFEIDRAGRIAVIRCG